jgi:hypothetical protein
MSVQIEIARHQWEDGHRRFRSAADDPVRYERLTAHISVLIEQLRRRIGQVFTLADLADEYRRAESWSRDFEPLLVPPADLATAEDAAFHLYARRARDFGP